MSDEHNEPPASGGLNPNALTPEQAARLLTKVGAAPVTEEMILADIAAGAPTNPDGTISIVHYAAWCVQAIDERRRSRQSG